MAGNIDKEVVKGFGQEWSAYDQSGLDPEEKKEIFGKYFSVFPWELLPEDGGVGADIGCGSGRWAALVAPRVRKLHLIDASGEALDVARRNLDGIPNVEFHHSGVDEMPIPDRSLDFAYSLGVLHHLPDTEAAIRSVASKLRPGAPFLVYLYYAFDNRHFLFSAIWRASDLMRRIVSRLPFALKNAVCVLIAALVYWPMARAGLILDRLGFATDSWPLIFYMDKSFYLMKTCSLDRFGTRLEQRFTRREITQMLSRSGFKDVRFSDSAPYWCAVGIMKSETK